jgi:hypothetical protein
MPPVKLKNCAITEYVFASEPSVETGIRTSIVLNAAGLGAPPDALRALRGGARSSSRLITEKWPTS